VEESLEALVFVIDGHIGTVGDALLSEALAVVAHQERDDALLVAVIVRELVHQFAALAEHLLRNLEQFAALGLTEHPQVRVVAVRERPDVFLVAGGM